VSPPGTPRDELAAGSEVGNVYLRRLVRAQLQLSLTALLAFGGLVGSLPAALYVLPGLQRVVVLGLPLPLVLLGLPISVLLIAIARIYQRRADALDQAFRTLLDDA
jgi:hypothetical protein